MVAKKQTNIRMTKDAKDSLLQIAEQEGMTYAEVARRLLEPAIKLAERYGFLEVSSELRRQANDALGLGSSTLRRQVARARAKLPLKSSRPKSGGPKMQFG
jgi:DNA helicase TIP49 (TBP-interacting protein)